MENKSTMPTTNGNIGENKQPEMEVCDQCGGTGKVEKMDLPSEEFFEEMRKNIFSKMEEGRFKMPTDEQVIKFAVIFNDGKLQPKKLTDMVGMCMLIIDRLHENGDIMIPSSKENLKT